MSLDDNLKEITYQYYGLIGKLDDINEAADNTDSFIAQIKQAFADKGYEKRDPIIQDGTLYSLFLKGKEGWMTGQEWYSLFEREFEKSHHGMPLTSMEVKMKEVAKRAAGIKDES